MIILCSCGTKLRLRHLARVETLRCPKCKAMVGQEAHRQAARNADAILEIAAYLAATPKESWTKEQEIIARILHAHETKGRTHD